MAEKIPFKIKITPKFIRPYVKIWSEEGFTAFFKKAGWKVVLGVVVFYLVRDSIIYIALPYLVAKGIFQF